MIPFCRLSVTYDSFISSAIGQWNSLNSLLWNVDSIVNYENGNVPKYYEIGPPKLITALTLLLILLFFIIICSKEI
jgi:hypothetical protein